MNKDTEYSKLKLIQRLNLFFDETAKRTYGEEDLMDDESYRILLGTFSQSKKDSDLYSKYRETTRKINLLINELDKSAKLLEVTASSIKRYRDLYIQSLKADTILDRELRENIERHIHLFSSGIPEVVEGISKINFPNLLYEIEKKFHKPTDLLLDTTKTIKEYSTLSEKEKENLSKRLYSLLFEIIDSKRKLHTYYPKNIIEGLQEANKEYTEALSNYKTTIEYLFSLTDKHKLRTFKKHIKEDLKETKNENRETKYYPFKADKGGYKIRDNDFYIHWNYDLDKYPDLKKYFASLPDYETVEINQEEKARLENLFNVL